MGTVFEKYRNLYGGRDKEVKSFSPGKRLLDRMPLAPEQQSFYVLRRSSFYFVERHGSILAVGGGSMLGINPILTID